MSEREPPGPVMRIAIDIDSTLHHHWPLVAAAAERRFGVELPYEQQFPGTTRRLTEEQLRVCIDDTHSDEAIAGAHPYPSAVETVHRWDDAGHSIHIVSQRARRSVPATRRWLDRIGLRRHELWCGDGKLARCRELGIDLLVDDSPENLLRALDAGIGAATLRHPWNAHVCNTRGIASGADWPELARVLGPLLDDNRGASWLLGRTP